MITFMIANQCLTEEWIARKRGDMGNVDPALLEKSIHALALLCALGESSIPFVFKGGTSMILLLKEFHRLSIDIDIEMEKDVKVHMPVIDCLLGDKLTAFAPNTIGIHYAQKSSMQIIKQLFDVGELFNAAENLVLVHKSYQSFSEAEIRYRGGKYTQEQALEDTLQTGIKICGLGLRGTSRDKHAEILTDGIGKISSHLVNTRFRLEEAKISASRAVLLAASLKTQPKEHALKDFRWDPKRVSELPSLVLKPPLGNLNRIKSLIPEAFYNLYTAQDLLE